MTDLLIRNVPDDVLAAIDARAAKLGISRTEYLKRKLAQEHSASGTVSIEDLRSFSVAVADLADEALMDDAWH